MSEDAQAQKRIHAIGRQLSSTASASASASSSQPLPPIIKRAPGSSARRVQGKVVIVTGANSALGIGRATAHQYAESGARAIYLCDIDDSNLDAHCREITAAFPHVEVHTRRLDAASDGDVKSLIDAAMECYGRLDVFFANAGMTGAPLHFTQCTDDEFMNIIKVNTLSVFLAVKYAAPAMVKTSPSKPQANGSIVATASVAGLRSNAGPSAYSAAKAAVISLVQTTSFQLAGTGVRVNAICPGLIETGMTEAMFVTARQRGTENRIGQLNPAKRAGYPDEIARVALFLGSHESSYVNGQAWAVDGGLSAGHPFVPGKLA